MTTDLPDDLFTVQLEDPDTGEIRETLSFERSPTVLLNFAAGRFARYGVPIFAEKLGLPAMDWRMLVMFTQEPGATAARACETTGFDKGAISRSIHRLEKAGHVRSGDLHSNGRSRGWYLTEAGKQLHDKGLKISIERQKDLFRGFEMHEIETLCDLLRRFLVNLDDKDRI
ncbi:MarR family winged helix-turn-helix transcriptional regulator [Microbulbifer sp. S227A]|uniref:MarR family winged helix-turn-helix transcriptional regulator n=1 Tax=Microbulbifer sp. S227A TaxID=3415131 RepID=UPI003C7B1BB8